MYVKGNEGIWLFLENNNQMRVCVFDLCSG